MRLTTICYIEKDDSYLMLHRTKKQNDQSHDKWLGVGGKFEKDESPDECMLREVKEETGLTLESFRLPLFLLKVTLNYISHPKNDISHFVKKM